MSKTEQFIISVKSEKFMSINKKTYKQFFVSTWRAITSWLPRND